MNETRCSLFLARYFFRMESRRRLNDRRLSGPRIVSALGLVSLVDPLVSSLMLYRTMIRFSGGNIGVTEADMACLSSLIESRAAPEEDDSRKSRPYAPNSPG